MHIRKEKYFRPYDEIYEASLKLVKQLGWTVVSSDKTAGKIMAESGISLRSWGENISIEISKEGTASGVSISSISGAQLFDWGKSEESERLFHEELKKIV